jgi:hypothetical protein
MGNKEYEKPLAQGHAAAPGGIPPQVRQACLKGVLLQAFVQKLRFTLARYKGRAQDVEPLHGAGEAKGGQPIARGIFYSNILRQ